MGTSEFLKSLVQAFLKRQETTAHKSAKAEILASTGAMLLYMKVLHRLFKINLEIGNLINGGNDVRLLPTRWWGIWLPTPVADTYPRQQLFIF